MMFPLAACGSSEGSVEAMKAGEWEITTKGTSLEVTGTPPGLTKEAANNLLKPADLSSVEKACLTAEQLANANSPLLAGGDEKDECTTTNASIKDGKIKGTFNCKAFNAKIDLDGTYMPESFNTNMAATMSDPSGLAFNLKGTVTGKRLGECTPGKKA